MHRVQRHNPAVSLWPRGGCFKCHWAGAPLGDPSDPRSDHRLRCGRPNSYPASMPVMGCYGWAVSERWTTSETYVLRTHEVEVLVTP